MCIRDRRHTDFIFAVFGEEFGLIGNALLLLLYTLLIGRAMVVTANASTMFARLLSGAVTLMLFTKVFVNMGMVSGVLPVVGVPLPFVSYGGTALVSMFIGLGVLMVERFGDFGGAWQIKLGLKQEANVPWRNQQVIDRLRQRAVEAGVPPDLCEALWRQMIGWFIQYEEEKLRSDIEAAGKSKQ